ncbi:hypothetical protein [Citrobacter sp. Cu096]|nr:hypothetical protein [Citrobacter sp. Cu096]MDM2742968.1 hypothetical protein [Citrobacter sp. Cu096]
MKKIIISLVILFMLAGLTWWFIRHQSGTDLQCQSTFEKNTASGNHAAGTISVHFFSDYTGVANITGKIVTEKKYYIINREIEFTYDVIDIQKGMFKVKSQNMKILLRDDMNEFHNDDINLNAASKSSDYIIIKK